MAPMPFPRGPAHKIDEIFAARKRVGEQILEWFLVLNAITPVRDLPHDVDLRELTFGPSEALPPMRLK